jgi:hypothetical protein
LVFMLAPMLPVDSLLNCLSTKRSIRQVLPGAMPPSNTTIVFRLM